MESLLQRAMNGGEIKDDLQLHKINVEFGPVESGRDLKVAHTRIAEPMWKKSATTYDSLIPSISISSSLSNFFGAPSHDPAMIFEPALNSERPSPIWKGSLVRDVFTRRTFRELPSKFIALTLIDEAFNSLNSALPLFDQKIFMDVVHDQYSESGPDDPGWWACINVVLSLAHRFRAMRTLQSSIENGEACAYMQNALGVVSELTMLHNSLPAVQALLGMAVVLEGTPNPRLCSVLVANAMRLAQAMGLHRQNNDSSLTEAEVEQRKRVFWIAYLLDKDISLRTGQPPAQDEDDMDVKIPSYNTPHLPLDGSDIDSIDFFNSRIGLAIIQGQVYKRLYSVKAMRQSESEQFLAVHELNAMLSTWRSSVPIDFDEETLTTLQAPICPSVLHKIILRFNYVNCLIIIHRPFPRDNGSSAPSDELCVSEARKAVQLIKITPQGDYACAW